LTPPGASPCQAEPSPPLPTTRSSPERRCPWEPEPAAMDVRRRASLYPPPSKVSSPMCSRWFPLRFLLLTRAPCPTGRRCRCGSVVAGGSLPLPCSNPEEEDDRFCTNPPEKR
jgi:hypothetical protein